MRHGHMEITRHQEENCMLNFTIVCVHLNPVALKQILLKVIILPIMTHSQKEMIHLVNKHTLNYDN